MALVLRAVSLPSLNAGYVVYAVMNLEVRSKKRGYVIRERERHKRQRRASLGGEHANMQQLAMAYARALISLISVNRCNRCTYMAAFQCR